MSTNTSKNWYYYIRKKGRRYYLGLVDENGAAPTAAYTIDIYYDEVPDELLSNDDTFPIPAQFEMGIIKGVAAELMMMENRTDGAALAKVRAYNDAYEKAVNDAIHRQITESQQPLFLKPLDLRDDDSVSNPR